MKITSVTLKDCAFSASQFCYDKPQFVFAGRSNVGKSSLLRTLANRRKLVRVGKTPGVTQSVNFFLVNEDFYFVDLPGYGFAKTPKSVQNKWKNLIENYFKEAIDIKKIILLLDVRHEPSEKDVIFFEWVMAYHLPILIVLTKADKVSKNEAMNRKFSIMKQFSLDSKDCLLFSATKKTGREEILKELSNSLGSD